MGITPEPRITIQHLLNVTSPYNFDSPDFQLINEGVNSLTEDFNPETETTQYIAERNATNFVKRYAPSISLTTFLVKGDKVNDRIREVINTLPIGGSADTDYVRFNLMDLTEQSGTTLKYVGYRRRATITASNIGGEAGDTTEASITLAGKGDVIKGIVTVDTSGATPSFSFVADSSTIATVTFTATGSVKGATLQYGNQTKEIDSTSHKAIFTVPKGYSALYEAVSGSQHAYGRATASQDSNDVPVTLA